MDSKGEAVVVRLDLANAFDRVGFHGRLLSNLLSYGIPGDSTNALPAF